MRKVRLGILGLGGRGHYFARCYDQHPDAELVAVADPDAAVLARVKPAYGDRIDYYEDLGKFLSRDDMEAVVIASPDHAHRDNAVQAFGCGKHVLLEKPMAQSVADTDDILRAWQAAGTVLQVGLELRYCALFVRMGELLNEGLLGDLTLGTAIDNVSGGGDYFYHDRQRTKAYAVSLLMQKGVHTIALLNWFLGGTPTKVYATGSLAYFGGDQPNDKRCRDCDQASTCPSFVRWDKFLMDYGETIEKPNGCVFSAEVDVNDNSQVLITYANGNHGVYTECHFTPEYTRDFELVGDKGKRNALYNNECNFTIRNQYRHTDRVDEWHPKSAGGGHGGGDPRLQQAFLD